MESIYSNLCTNFTCLAGDCPSTCCAGWQIRVDESAYQHFLGMEDTLSQDILSHIEHKGGLLRFQNQPGGRCSMLDDDGLCRIQRNASEADLCNTCRKFPRLSAVREGQIWLSMAASCPVIARRLWKEELRWIHQDDRGIQHQMEQQKIPVLQEGMEWYQEALRQVDSRRRLHQKHLEPAEASQRIQRKRFAALFDLVELWSDLLLEFPERPYLQGSFDLFERPDWEEESLYQPMQELDQTIAGDWEHFLNQYLPYRIFTDQLEHPDNAVMLSTQLAMEECALLYTILFSRLQSGYQYSEELMLETIDWVYRFCAHGEKIYQKIVEKVQAVFPDLCQMGEIVKIFV